VARVDLDERKVDFELIEAVASPGRGRAGSRDGSGPERAAPRKARGKGTRRAEGAGGRSSGRGQGADGGKDGPPSRTAHKDRTNRSRRR